ncbi:MAG: (Fe-S)-binding protein [Bacteroidales bacterium]|nr:(Fe-S)-binding protein [Bacteroidales bacterium]MDY6444341.1 (Fe-S)-binding protein [Bacteroidales bacterium]
MRERFASGFDPFVIPFVIGMVFVLGYCLIAMVRVVCQLPKADRKRFLLSLITPKYIWMNVRDIFLNCLIHVKLWKRNKVLGYMHSSIAFGWFMLIVLGHLEVMLFVPERIRFFYYPIFFNYFVAETEQTLQGALLMFLMDFFLLLVLSGIVLAIIKRFVSRIVGMRRTTRLSVLDQVGLYSLWAIFPLRLLAESFTAHISGGSFLTIPANWVFRQFLGNDLNALPTWWAYSIALCIFMCVLPFTRYMHIPAEMLLIPMRNAGIKIRHPRKGFALLEVYSCPACGVCIDACPMSVRKANLRDCTVYLNRMLRRGNERRIAEISDKCLLCGKCSAVCQVGVQGPELRIAQRERRKFALSPSYADLDVRPMAEAVAGSGGVLYFAGCMTQLTPSILRATGSLLDKAGVSWKMMDPDGGLCCGRPLMMAGRTEQARELIAKNVEIIRASGCDTLLLSCPICYRVFKEEYPLEGIRVVHHSVFFQELIAAGKLPVQREDGLRLVWHDPCELGRGCGIYEQPRAALAAAGEVVEAGKNHAESICCGGSLGSLSLSFEQRRPMTQNALDNLTVADPDQIVTGCPLCLATFVRAADRPVRDLAEILDEHC